VCKLAFDIDNETDRRVEVQIDEKAGKARVTVLRETGKNHVVELDIASGKQETVAA
jgi:hypothetical protein